MILVYLMYIFTDLAVIFLDVDGVLHPARGPGSNSGLSIFEAPKMANLKALVECVQPHARIVLSSNWRQFDHMKRRVDDEIKKVGIHEGIYDCTDVINGTDRHTEVCHWLTKFKPSRFVIVDDLDLSKFNSLAMCLKRYQQTGIWSVTKKHFVCTDFIDGLDSNALAHCVKVLQTVKRVW